MGNSVPYPTILAQEVLARVFNSQLSYTGYPTKAKEPCLPYYLPMTGRRRDGFIPFSRAFVQSEMQTASFRFELSLPIPFPTLVDLHIHILLDTMLTH